MRIDTGQEWAEVCFVPNEIGNKKDGPEYRFLAIREPFAQPELPGLEKSQEALPFPTMDFGESKTRHKLFGVVTKTALKRPAMTSSGGFASDAARARRRVLS